MVIFSIFPLHFRAFSVHCLTCAEIEGVSRPIISGYFDAILCVDVISVFNLHWLHVLGLVTDWLPGKCE